MITGYRKDTEKEKIVLDIGHRLEINNLARDVGTSHYNNKYYVDFYLTNTGNNRNEREIKRNQIIKKLNRKYPNIHWEGGSHPDYIRVNITIETNIDDLL